MNVLPTTPEKKEEVVTQADSPVGTKPLVLRLLVRANFTRLLVTAVVALAAAALIWEPSIITLRATISWRQSSISERQTESSKNSSGYAWRLNSKLCSQHPVSLSCAPGGWTPLQSNELFLEGDAACNHLATCNISRIAFVGDRYAGHVFTSREAHAMSSNRGCLDRLHTSMLECATVYMYTVARSSINKKLLVH
jgi:hypothetical protein